MPQTHEDLAETHILGPKSSQLVVRVDDMDPRDWLASSPKCSALAQHRIAHLGVAKAVSQRFTLPPLRCIIGWNSFKRMSCFSPNLGEWMSAFPCYGSASLNGYMKNGCSTIWRILRT
jgi:hypothetical protein